MDIKAFLAKQKKEKKPKEGPAPIDAKVTEYVSGLPHQNFTLAPKEKPKTDKKPIFIAAAVVVGLVLICILVFALWPKSSSKPSTDKPSTEPEEVVEDEPEEETNEKLMQKVNAILSFGTNNSKDKTASYPTPNSDTSIYTKLTDNNRFYIAAELVDQATKNKTKLGSSDIKKFDNYTCQRIFDSNCSGVSNDVYNAWYKLDSQKVKDNYANLFGALPGTLPTEKIGACPSYYYIANADIFIGAGQCGNSPTTKVTFYQYKVSYSLDDTKAYVYFAAGTIKPVGTSFELYSDLASEVKVKDLTSNEYKITESNYQDFSQYRMVFSKKDNKYVYRNVIEPINEDGEDNKKDDKNDSKNEKDNKDDEENDD